MLFWAKHRREYYGRVEEVGRPYNIGHTGHVGKYHVGGLVNYLEAKEDNPGYVLTYFPIRGRAETIRLVLHDTKTPFVEKNPTDWKATKEELSRAGKLTFGQVPLLQAARGDFSLVQSNAILRHLGRKLDRYGQSDEERSQIDVVVDGVEDLRIPYGKLIYDNKLSEDAQGPYLEKLRNYLESFEKLLHRNKEGRAYFVGENFSIGDAAVFDILDLQLRIWNDILDKYPLLKDFYQRVASRPNIAAYLKSDKRPARANNNGLG